MDGFEEKESLEWDCPREAWKVKGGGGRMGVRKERGREGGAEGRRSLGNQEQMLF